MESKLVTLESSLIRLVTLESSLIRLVSKSMSETSLTSLVTMESSWSYWNPMGVPILDYQFGLLNKPENFRLGSYAVLYLQWVIP